MDPQFAILLCANRLFRNNRYQDAHKFQTGIKHIIRKWSDTLSISSSRSFL